MRRTIITARDVSTPKSGDGPAAQLAGEPQVPDSYIARVLKLIPAEVVSLYVTLEAMCATGDLTFRWAAFGTGFLGTAFYLRAIAHVEKWGQILLSMVAFVVWAAALGGPFEAAGLPRIYAAFALVIFTFILPALVPVTTTSPEDRR